MRLIDLLTNVDVVKIIGKAEVEVIDLSINSKVVSKNTLFICINGGNTDSHNFIKEAETFGASCVLCEKELDTGLTQVIVKDSREAMGKIASNFYGNPERKLKIIGVTGTNGKTTTSTMIYSILKASGKSAGLIGTNGIFYGDKSITAKLTTPDPIDLFKYFSQMVNSGIKYVVMEVSAHASHLNKVSGINFDVLVFTNFSQDHLDYFKTMEEYKKAKMKLFERKGCSFVINTDDLVGRELFSKLNGAFSYGIDNPSDCFAIDIKNRKDSQSCIVNIFDNVCDLHIKMMGKYNIYNCLASLTVCSLLGLQLGESVYALEQIQCVEGRMEKIFDGDFSIYVDYAHTPDGLKNALETLKKIAEGKLICVFGCGGNRDSLKRSVMGEISAKIADFTIITSDNPRYEDPMEIIHGIEKGVIKITKNYILIQDRKEGIKYAVSHAKSGDIILIAGKGAENYQEVFGVKREYNDKTAVKEILESEF